MSGGRGERSRAQCAQAGFTLMEVMVAVAILGTALFVLLDAHYAALNLYDSARESSIEQNLMRQAMGMAESDVQAGNLSASGDFGDRYPDYRYAYEATRVSDEPGVSLYDVVVQVEGPSGTREMHLLVFTMSESELL